jgi:ATP-dependent RNA helicase RhlE
MSKFLELGVSPRLIEAMDKRGIEAPFPIQELVIPDAMAGKDVLAKSRTGSGKTLAFAVPMVEKIEASEKGPVALVLAPTRELAVQVAEEFRWLGESKGIKVAPVYGGVALEKQAAKARKSHVIVATPGRLEDIEKRGLVSLEKIRILVLDEADRMLDIGFQPQVDRIVSRLKGKRQTLFFSATLEGRVLWMANAYTTDPITHEVVTPEADMPSADHRFVSVDEHTKVDALVKILEEDRKLALVFVRTKRGADRLGIKLRGRGLNVSVLHGDMTQAARQKTLDRFAASQDHVLVATDVAARGIHMDNISHVINYDAPEGREDYIHRTGRTARAGRTGIAVTLVGPMQSRGMGLMAKNLNLADEFEESGMKVAKPMTIYRSRPRGRRR